MKNKDEEVIRKKEIIEKLKDELRASELKTAASTAYIGNLNYLNERLNQNIFELLQSRCQLNEQIRVNRDLKLINEFLKSSNSASKVELIKVSI